MGLSGIGETRRRRAVLLAVLAAALLAGGWFLLRLLDGSERPPPRVAVLGRQLAALEGFLEAHPEGFPRAGDDALVVRLESSVLEGALTGVLPYEGRFGGGLLLRLDGARVSLQGGLPVVRLTGRASLSEGGAVSAEVAVLLTLDLEVADAALVTRPTVLGFDLGAVQVGQASGRVADALRGVAEEVFLAVAERLAGVEIPVLVPDGVDLPAVEEPEVTIPGARLPLAVRLHDVLPMDGRLWVALSVAAGDAAASVPPASSAETPDPCASGRAAGVDWCALGADADTAALARAVAGRSDSARALLAAAFPDQALDSVEVAVRMARPLLQELLATSAGVYLDSVALHVESGIEVREEGDVGTSLGPLPIPLGSWTLELTIQTLYATFRGGTPVIESMEDDRLELRVPVEVADARGRVRVRFAWDAAAVAGLLCSDFSVDEVFDGAAPPSIKELRGRIRFSVGPRGLVADPEQTEPLVVRPIAEAAAWERVREVLRERDGPLECGMGMDAEELEARLRERMNRGFDFRLPAALLRPLVLPAFVRTRAEVADARYRLEARPRSVRLGEEALTYGFSLSLEGGPANASDAVPRAGG